MACSRWCAWETPVRLQALNHAHTSSRGCTVGRCTARLQVISVVAHPHMRQPGPPSHHCTVLVSPRAHSLHASPSCQCNTHTSLITHRITQSLCPLSHITVHTSQSTQTSTQAHTQWHVCIHYTHSTYSTKPRIHATHRVYTHMRYDNEHYHMSTL